MSSSAQNLTRIDELIEQGKKVEDSYQPDPPGVFFFPNVDRELFSKWTSSVKNFFNRVFGANSIFLKDFTKEVDDAYVSKVRTGLGMLHAARDEIGYLPSNDEASATAHDSAPKARTKITVFIGHGGDPQWRELESHLRHFDKLNVTSFESSVNAGYGVFEVLEQKLNEADMGLIVHTAEDDTGAPDVARARENVIHEMGLFQGRFGLKRAIILLEEGCNEYSNIRGIVQLRFPRGNIASKFGDVDLTIRREFADALR